MKSYIDRYHAGDRTAVWAELVGLGPAVRSEPVLTDAREVAQEIMRRARHNVAQLVARLKMLDYRFVDPDRAWVPPEAGTAAALDEVEARHGPLPIVIRVWFEIVGGVNLMGAHPDLSTYRGLAGGDVAWFGCYPDPMVVAWPVPPGAALEPYHAPFAESWDEADALGQTARPPYALDFGLSAVNKANESGAGAVQMLVPNPGFDAPLIDWEVYWMGTFFMPYLRICFDWGGFPGLQYMDEVDLPEEELDYLCDGLLEL